MTGNQRLCLLKYGSLLILCFANTTSCSRKKIKSPIQNQDSKYLQDNSAKPDTSAALKPLPQIKTLKASLGGRAGHSIAVISCNADQNTIYTKMSWKEIDQTQFNESKSSSLCEWRLGHLKTPATYLFSVQGCRSNSQDPTTAVCGPPSEATLYLPPSTNTIKQKAWEEKNKIDKQLRSRARELFIILQKDPKGVEQDLSKLYQLDSLKESNSFLKELIDIAKAMTPEQWEDIVANYLLENPSKQKQKEESPLATEQDSQKINGATILSTSFLLLLIGQRLKNIWTDTTEKPAKRITSLEGEIAAKNKQIENIDNPNFNRQSNRLSETEKNSLKQQLVDDVEKLNTEANDLYEKRQLAASPVAQDVRQSKIKRGLIIGGFSGLVGWATYSVFTDGDEKALSVIAEATDVLPFALSEKEKNPWHQVMAEIIVLQGHMKRLNQEQNI